MSRISTRTLQRTVQSLRQGFRRRLGLAPSASAAKYDRQALEALARLRDWRGDDTVLDIGANDGRTVLRLAEHLPVLPRVLAFEPTAGAFALLAERTAHLPQVTPFRLAVGAAPGRATIHVNPHSALSSLDPEWGEARSSEEVEITTVDRILSDQGLTSVQLLKIDVEGHDLEVLKGARRALAEGRVEAIQIEVGFGQPGRHQPSLEEIRLFLQPYGLFLRHLHNQCHAPLPEEALLPGAGRSASPGVLTYADALFVRVPSAVRPGNAPMPVAGAVPQPIFG